VAICGGRSRRLGPLRCDWFELYAIERASDVLPRRHRPPGRCVRLQELSEQIVVIRIAIVRVAQLGREYGRRWASGFMVRNRVVLREISPNLIVALIEQPDHLAIGIEIAIERGVLARESTSGKHRVGRELVVPGQLVLGTKRHALEARLRVPIGV